MTKIERQEMEDLKKDIGLFFKWYGLQTDHRIMQARKMDAVKAQNFEQACNYRDEEVKILEKWEATNDKLLEVAEKYLKEEPNS